MPPATPLEKVPYLFGKGNQPFRTRCLTFSDGVRHPWRRGNRVKVALHPRVRNAGRVPPQPSAANGSPSPSGARAGVRADVACQPFSPQLHRPTGIVEELEYNRIEGLLLGAGRHILRGQCGEKTFQLLFTRQMSRQFDHECAVSLKPSAIALLGRQRQMFAPQHVGHPVPGIREVHARILTPPFSVAYQNYCDCLSHIKS